MGSRHWTTEEDEELQRLFRLGYNDAKIGKKLKRPAAGVLGRRVRILGLRRRDSDTRALATVSPSKGKPGDTVVVTIGNMVWNGVPRETARTLADLLTSEMM